MKSHVCYNLPPHIVKSFSGLCIAHLVSYEIDHQGVLVMLHDEPVFIQKSFSTYLFAKLGYFFDGIELLDLYSLRFRLTMGVWLNTMVLSVCCFTVIFKTHCPSADAISTYISEQ